MVDDVQMTSLGPTLVIVKEDLVMTGQTAQPPGEDSNRIGQQLRVLRIAVGAFHGRGVDPNLAAPFQPLPVCPKDQEPVDLLPGSGLDAADVPLEAGGAGSSVKGERGEGNRENMTVPYSLPAWISVSLITLLLILLLPSDLRASIQDEYTIVGSSCPRIMQSERQAAHLAVPGAEQVFSGLGWMPKCQLIAEPLFSVSEESEKRAFSPVK